jgi:hypothetical protein
MKKKYYVYLRYDGWRDCNFILADRCDMNGYESFDNAMLAAESNYNIDFDHKKLVLFILEGWIKE